MKKTIVFTGLIVAATTLADIASAQTAITSFTSGDLVVERVGDGTAAVTSAGTAVFLDEYTPAGALVGTYALPSSGTTPLVDTSAGSDGLLSTSSNGQYLLVPGYDAPVGTASITGATSTVVPREVATVSSAGTLVQTTINSYSGNNFRAVASPDGTTIYTAGANSTGNAGILSVTSGATNATGTAINSTNTNYTNVAIFNGQLYAASARATGFSLGTIGTGIPTTVGQTATQLPGTTSGTGGTIVAPTAFVAATLTTGSTATDTFYVADSGKINKFTLAGGTYSLTGSVTLTGVFGLLGQTLANGTEQLYATTSAGLYSLTDTGGTTAFTATTPLEIAAAGTNELDRGVTFAPGATAVPEPAIEAWLGVCGGAFLLMYRLRRRLV